MKSTKQLSASRNILGDDCIPRPKVSLPQSCKMGLSDIDLRLPISRFIVPILASSLFSFFRSLFEVRSLNILSEIRCQKSKQNCSGWPVKNLRFLTMVCEHDHWTYAWDRPRKSWGILNRTKDSNPRFQSFHLNLYFYSGAGIDVPFGGF